MLNNKEHDAMPVSASPAAVLPTPAPHTSRYIEVNGTRLHLLDYGGAGKPPLLCLHGGSAHAHWFDFVAGEFVRDYHVMSLDQRGHGDSAWAEPPAYDYANFVSDLQQVIQKLGQDVVLMGHSMGGLVSLLHTARHPQHVKGLIVIDTTLMITGEKMAARQLRGAHGGKAYATLEEYLARFRLRPERNFSTPEMLRYMASHAARRGEDGLWRHKIDRRILGSRSAVNGVEEWAKIKCPALLVKAAESARLTPAIIAGVKANCPQVELAQVPSSEHHIPLDNPEGLKPVVRAFLDRHFKA
jgi:pimeloyl-ACP methyl ester carboxylesterase